MITLAVLIGLTATALAVLVVRRRIQVDRAHARQLAQLKRRPGTDDQFGTWPRIRVPWTDRPEGEA